MSFDKNSYSDDSDVRAYMNGIYDACDYDACNPNSYNYEGDQYSSYVEGYGDGMDINMNHQGGICPDDLRG